MSERKFTAEERAAMAEGLLASTVTLRETGEAEDTPTIPLPMDPRVRVSQGVARMLDVAAAPPSAPAASREGPALRKGLPAADGAAWFRDVLDLGAPALLRAAAQVLECEDVTALGRNPISAIADLVATQVRRAFLLESLERNAWDMDAVALETGMGTTGNLVSLLTRHDLLPEYRAAQAKGLARTRGRSKRGPAGG